MKRDYQTDLVRQVFYARIPSRHLAPLREVLHALVSPALHTPCAATRWGYAELRPFLAEAGRLITADEECVLFSSADRPVHEALGIWRGECLDAGT